MPDVAYILPISPTTSPTQMMFLDKLKNLYTHFERNNQETTIAAKPSTDHQALALFITDVYKDYCPVLAHLKPAFHPPVLLSIYLSSK